MSINGFGPGKDLEKDIFGVKSLAADSLDALRTTTLQPESQDPKPPTPPSQPVVEKPQPDTQPIPLDVSYQAAGEDNTDAIVEYERKRAEAKKTEFMVAWEHAIKTDPDRAAKAYAIADQRGIPRDLVTSNIDIANEILKEEAINYDKLKEETPWTESVFQNQSRKLQSHDDIENYQALEKEVNGFGDSMKAGWLDMYRGYLGLQVALGLVDKEYNRNDPNQWVSDETRQTLLDLELNINELRANPAWYAPIAEEAAQLAIEVPTSLAAAKTGQLVGTGVGAVFGPPGAAVGGTVGGTAGFFVSQAALTGAQEMGNKYLEMRSKGYTHEEAFGASVNTAIATGVLDAISGQIGRIPWKKMMRPGSEVRKALLEGVAKASARQFSDKAKEKIWKEALKEYAYGGASEIVTETVQQASSMVIESMAYADIAKDDRGRITSAPALNWEDKANSDWSKIGEELWSTAVDTAIASSVFNGIGPAGNYYRSKMEINKALKDEAKLQAIIGKASGVKTFERDPAGARRELAELMEKNGVAKMHIYASELRDFIRSMDESAVAEASGGDADKATEIRSQMMAESPTEKNLREAMPELMKQLDEASDGDVDLEIDSSQLLSSMSRTDSIKTFARYMRVSADSISVASAEKNRGLLDDMKKQAESLLEMERSDKNERVLAKDRVVKIIEGQLLSAGMKDADAKEGAAYQAAVIVLQAENFGMMPDMYLERFGSQYMSEAEYNKAVQQLQSEGTLTGVSVEYKYGEEGASESFRLTGMVNPTAANVADAISTVEQQIAIANERGLTSESPEVKSMLAWLDMAREYKANPEMKLKQFAGSMALTADKAAQQSAKAKLDAGADPEQIRKDTGWFVGNDGMMRFEIPDNQSALIHKPEDKPDDFTEGASVRRTVMAADLDKYRKQLNKLYKNEENNRTFYLGDLLKHDKLFAAYPWLKSLSVVFPDANSEDALSTTSYLVNGKLLADKKNWKEMLEQGQTPEGVSIQVGVMNPKELRILLAHEISHVIQSYEGFAPGANPGMAGNLSTDGNKRALNTKLATEANARYASIRKFGDNLLDAFYSDLAIAKLGDRARILDWIKSSGSIPEGMSEDAAVAYAEQLRTKLLNSSYGKMMSVSGINGVSKKDARGIRKVTEEYTKFFWYTIVEGEREAAAVEQRIDMTDNELKIANPKDYYTYPGINGIVIPVDAKLRTKSVFPSSINNEDFDVDPNAPAILESPGMRGPDDFGIPLEVRKENAEAEAAEDRYRAFVDLRRMITALTQNADFTTIAHESQHVYEKSLIEMAGKEESPQHVNEQAMRLLTWAGVEGKNLAEKKKNYYLLPVEERTKLSESLAYNYELYLAEGKAPLPELEEYYGAVSKLVRGVYKNVVKDLNEAYKAKFGKDLPGMDKDIRAFFDRMLASEDQIRRTMNLRMMSPVLISDQQAKQLKISDVELQNIRDLERIAFDESVEQLTAKSVRGLVWVKNKIARRNKELAKQADEVEAKLRVEVEAEVGERTPYKILRLFGEGDLSAIDPTLVNNPELSALQQERYKLKDQKAEAKKQKNKVLAEDIDKKISAVSKTIKEAEKAARKKKLPRPKIDIESVSKVLSQSEFERAKEILGSGVGKPLGRDGVNVNDVAAFFGYDSAGEMLNELMSMPSMEEAVEKRLKERMLNEHSNLASPQQRERAVVESIHNEARIKLIATQHNIIQRTLLMQFAASKPDVADGLRQVREEILYVLSDIEQIEQDLESARQAGVQETVDSLADVLEVRKKELDRLAKVADIPSASLADVIATAKFAATELVAKTPTGSLDLNSWRRREERLAKNASEALKDGDLQKALLLVKQQMIAHEMISSILMVQKEQGTIMEFFRKFSEHKKDDSRRRDSDHMVIGAEILRVAGFDFSKPGHDQRFAVVKEYNLPLIQQYQMIMDMVSKDASKVQKDKMTIKELRILHNIMLGVWNGATKARMVIRGDKQTTLEQADKDLVNQIRVGYGNVKAPPKGGSGKQNWRKTGGSMPGFDDEDVGDFVFDDPDGDFGAEGEQPREKKDPALVPGVPNLSQGQTGAGSFRILENESLLGFGATLTRMQHWCEYMDGNRPDGPFTMYIWRPIKAACLSYRDAKLEYKQRYEAIIQSIRPNLTWHGIQAPELGFTFENKAQLLGAIQHMGNESNLGEMLRARQWGRVEFFRFIDRCFFDGTVTQQDMDAIQSIWNLNAELLPEAQRVHYDLYSYRFVPVPHRQLRTPWGTYPGGYIPIVRDPSDRRYSKGKEAKIQNAIDALYGESQMALPTTGRNWALNRGGESTWLVMDIDMSQQHIDSVLRFIHLMPAIRSVTNLIGNRTGLLGRALRMINPKIATNLIIPHLETVARQGTTLASNHPWLDRLARNLRKNSGYDVMFGLVQNAVANISGFAVYLSKRRYSPAAIRSIASASFRTIFAPGTANFVMSRSEMLRQRHDQRLKDVEDRTRRMLRDPSRSFGFRMDNRFGIFLGQVKDATFGRLQDISSDFAYVLQRLVQDPIDRSVWLAEYEYQQRQNTVGGQLQLTEEELIARADAAVELTQGSVDPENAAQSEVGKELYKIFTPLMSWASMMLNHNGGKFLTMLRELGFDPSNISPRHLPQAVALYLTAMWLPMIVGSHVNLVAAGGVKDSDEDDEWVDDYFKWLFKQTAQQGPAMIPVVGNAVNTLINYLDDAPYNDRMGGMPVITGLESVGRTMSNAADVFLEDKAMFDSGRDFKDAATAISMMFGIYLKPLAKPFAYERDVEVNRARPTSDFDYFRGMVTGTVSPESRR